MGDLNDFSSVLPIFFWDGFPLFFIPLYVPGVIRSK